MSSSPRQSLDAYDPFAPIYNQTIAEDFCRRAWPIIERLLLKRLPANAHVLDLCCGSGQMARELSRRGHKVAGIDVSEPMIRFARKNAPGASFFLADARRFYLNHKFDAVLSSFNSLAHAATVDELHSIFCNARAVLKPRSPMLFDLSMEEAYTSKWRGSFGGVQEEAAWIVRPSYNAASKLARNDVTLFHLTAGTWRRDDIVLSQTCHSETEIRTALYESGFGDVHCYDAQRDLAMARESGRSFFLCS